jgi:four helix bundle protein
MILKHGIFVAISFPIIMRRRKTAVMRDFKKLKVWDRAHQWVLKIYRITESFPPGEHLGLVAQLRRSAASISAKIAKGCGRESMREFSSFLVSAAASANEAEYQILLAHDLGYIDGKTYCELNKDITEVKKMLKSFIWSISPEN